MPTPASPGLASRASLGAIGPAIDELVATKSEHRTIIGTIAADIGMSPETRKILLDHLMAEEDERVAAVAAAASGSGAASASATGESGTTRGLTVGSLRVETAPADRLRLGSLRPR